MGAIQTLEPSYRQRIGFSKDWRNQKPLAPCVSLTAFNTSGSSMHSYAGAWERGAIGDFLLVATRQQAPALEHSHCTNTPSSARSYYSAGSWVGTASSSRSKVIRKTQPGCFAGCLRRNGVEIGAMEAQKPSFLVSTPLRLRFGFFLVAAFSHASALG